MIACATRLCVRAPPFGLRMCKLCIKQEPPRPLSKQRGPPPPAVTLGDLGVALADGGGNARVKRQQLQRAARDVDQRTHLVVVCGGGRVLGGAYVCASTRGGVLMEAGPQECTKPHNPAARHTSRRRAPLVLE